jgi:hypothetical protein
MGADCMRDLYGALVRVGPYSTQSCVYGHVPLLFVARRRAAIRASASRSDQSQGIAHRQSCILEMGHSKHASSLSGNCIKRTVALEATTEVFLRRSFAHETSSSIDAASFGNPTIGTTYPMVGTWWVCGASLRTRIKLCSCGSLSLCCSKHALVSELGPTSTSDRAGALRYHTFDRWRCLRCVRCQELAILFLQAARREQKAFELPCR